MNYIFKMATKQDSLNEITDNGWMENNRDFRRALRQEAGEAMDSTPWSWWKSRNLDIQNIIIEGTDMMHFALSVCLQERFDGWRWLDEEIKNRFDLQKPAASGHPVEEIQKTIDNIVYESFLHPTASSGPADLILGVVKLMWLVGMDRDDMFKLYFGKNVLNEFRQDHGYKDGTYIKEWDGKEDNVFMQDAIESIGISDHFEDDLYKLLDEKYKEVVDGED